MATTSDSESEDPGSNPGEAASTQRFLHPKDGIEVSPATQQSICKTEVHDVAVLDDVVLALEPHLAGFLGAGFAIERDEIVVGDGLGANKSLLEVGMDDAGGLWCPGAGRHRPRARLLRANGKVRQQVEQVIAGADQAIEARLFQAETLQELGSLSSVEACELRFDLG